MNIKKLEYTNIEIIKSKMKQELKSEQTQTEAADGKISFNEFLKELKEKRDNLKEEREEK